MDDETRSTSSRPTIDSSSLTRIFSPPVFVSSLPSCPSCPSRPTVAATLKMVLSRSSPPSASRDFVGGYPNPAAPKARRVHRLPSPAMCHSTASGAACRSSWFRVSMRACIAVTSTPCTAEQSSTIARSVGRLSSASICFPRRGPGSFQGRSYEGCISISLSVSLSSPA